MMLFISFSKCPTRLLFTANYDITFYEICNKIQSSSKMRLKKRVEHEPRHRRYERYASVVQVRPSPWIEQRTT